MLSFGAAPSGGSGPSVARNTPIEKANRRGVKRIFELAKAGHLVSEIARDPLVNHDPRTVARVLGRGPTKGAHGGKRRDVLGNDGRVLLFKLVKAFPQTSDGWRAKFMSKLLEKEVKVGVVRTAYEHLRLSAHTPTVLYSEGLTEKVFIEQATFLAFYEEKLRADPRFKNRTIFIDATSFNQQELVKRRRATGPIGGTVLTSAPSDRGENWDFVGGISRERGLMGAYVYQGHVDSDVIEAWLEHVLLPECDADDWLVLDGAGYWSGRHVVESKIWPLCESAGVNLLWLPTRSPWFNPIEKFNGWLKDRVADDIYHGRASRDNMTEAVHCAIERHTSTLPACCRGWIDFLFAQRGVH